jgi:hypothetical protein
MLYPNQEIILPFKVFGDAKSQITDEAVSCGDEKGGVRSHFSKTENRQYPYRLQKASYCGVQGGELLGVDGVTIEFGLCG